MQPKIKISKHMPDVFLHSRNFHKDKQKKNVQDKQKQRDKIQLQQKRVIQPDNHQKRTSNQDEVDNKKKKKSRNPFFNVREYMKMSKQMEQKMREVRQELDRERFTHFHLDNKDDIQPEHRQEPKQSKIKYQDCLTLSILKKSQSFSLKKVLHVPTLTVYFLRQSAIDFSIDKNELQEWIKKCNSQNNSTYRPQKITQLFWNIPESYYSIFYEYTDGVILQTILENTSMFPIQFIQNLSIIHMKADFYIYNSILLIKRDKQSEISYLPVYQEIDDLIPQYRSYKELLKISSFEENQDIKKVEKAMVARLGFLMLVSFFSAPIVDQDISNIYFQTKQCCLFHKQMGNNTSLMKIYFQQNLSLNSEKQIISDFFCKMLKFKPEDRASFSQLSKHKFLKSKFSGEMCQMKEVIRTLQSTGNSNSKNIPRQLSMHKFNKILNGMSLILQGVEQKQKKQVDISLTNLQIQYILNQLGFPKVEGDSKSGSNEIIGKLKKVYDS